MVRIGLLLLAAIAVSSSLAAEPAASTVRPSQLNVAEMNDVLTRHNDARRAVGIPPLTWSPVLAGYAQAWADEIGRSGKFEHRPYDGTATVFNGEPRYGENMAVGFGPGYGVAMAIDQWRAEESDYVTGTPVPELPEDFAQFKSGHYTQMVWRNTRSIGVGKAVIQTGDLAGWTVFVANYDPPGNAGGQKPY
jgi:pathogenesis-related protein 1